MPVDQVIEQGFVVGIENMQRIGDICGIRGRKPEIDEQGGRPGTSIRDMGFQRREPVLGYGLSECRKW